MTRHIPLVGLRRRAKIHPYKQHPPKRRTIKMGAGQSAPAPESTAQDMDSSPGRTHIGNYMAEDVRKWEQIKKSSESKDDGACSCEDSTPKMSPPYMGADVAAWEKIHMAVE